MCGHERGPVLSLPRYSRPKETWGLARGFVLWRSGLGDLFHKSGCTYCCDVPHKVVRNIEVSKVPSDFGREAQALRSGRLA